MKVRDFFLKDWPVKAICIVLALGLWFYIANEGFLSQQVDGGVPLRVINLAENLGKDIFFIGGNQIYKSALKIADYIYLSLVKGNYSGNVYFPEYDKKDWQMIDSKEYDKFTFIRYKRIF